MKALWQWFHQGWELVAWGAWEQDQLVAQYTCLVNTVISPQDTSFRVGLSVNMTVHSDFRGRGLIKQIAQPVYATFQAMGIGAREWFSFCCRSSLVEKSLCRPPYYLTAKPLTAELPASFRDFRHWDCSGGDIL